MEKVLTRYLTDNEYASFSGILERNGLRLETEPEEYCYVTENGNMVATGALEGNVMKYLSVREDMRGEGLLNTIVSSLMERAYEKGIYYLFIYTKPMNRELFISLGFHVIYMTSDVIFMENRRNGLDVFISKLIMETGDELLKAEDAAAIVMNADPLTKGHEYLIHEALKDSDVLHVFLLSYDRDMYPLETRMKMLKELLKDEKRAVIHEGGDYMISRGTFPTYFFKDKKDGVRAECELDIRLFGEKIAPALNIKKRFAGTEELSGFTATYNSFMERILPEYGIGFITVDRLRIDGRPVSASEVRRLVREGRKKEAEELVPLSTAVLL